MNIEVKERPIQIQTNLVAFNKFTKIVNDRSLTLEQIYAGIQRCGRRDKFCSKFYPPLINPEAEVIFLTRSPAYKNGLISTEEYKHIVNGLFESYLAYSGLSNVEMAVVNVVPCKQNHNVSTFEKVCDCSIYALFFMSLMKKAKVIVPMCDDAMRMLYGYNTKGLVASVGSIYHTKWVDGSDKLIVPVVSPTTFQLIPSLKEITGVGLLILKHVMENIRNNKGVQVNEI